MVSIKLDIGKKIELSIQEAKQVQKELNILFPQESKCLTPGPGPEPTYFAVHVSGDEVYLGD